MNDKIKPYIDKINSKYNLLKQKFLDLKQEQRIKIILTLFITLTLILFISYNSLGTNKSNTELLAKNIERLNDKSNNTIYVKPQEKIKNVNPILLNEYKRLLIQNNQTMDSEIFNKILAKEIQKMTKEEYKQDVMIISKLLSKAYVTNDFETLEKIRVCVLNKK